MSKTDAERRQMLLSLNLDPDAPALVAEKAKGKTKKPKEVSEHDPDEVVLAPPGVDPRAMPVEDIVFDPRLLDGYTQLGFNQQGGEASRHIFDLYKSYGRNKDRNGALQRKITSFITSARRNAETGGMVTEKIATTREERDLAALLASQGITAASLSALLKAQED